MTTYEQRAGANRKLSQHAPGGSVGAELTQSDAWQELLRHHEEVRGVRLADIVLGDPQRLEKCELALEGLRLNFALQAVTAETMRLLVNLARHQKVEDMRDRMFRGEKINATENRAVLHTALRVRDAGPVLVDGHDVMPEIERTRLRIAAFVKEVREGIWRGATGKPVRHVVNIGIGGSDLGPRLASRALSSFAAGGPEVHFASNVDSFDLAPILARCDPAETLFVVVSKTFTTQETLLNARAARAWLTAQLGEDAVAKHFVAVSASETAVRAFGIEPSRMFPMWDWVGGRFSLWSAVGVSAALALGMEAFNSMLDGAAAMDRHFLNAPLAHNMPVVLALLGVWQRDFLGAQAHAVLPYCERLRDLPRYLQQLEMESNGKTVARDGHPAGCPTAPVIFGDCGTVGQHSFHQFLHQGSEPVPADFIAVTGEKDAYPEHRQALLSNMVAQAGAFAFGQPKAATPFDVYPGGRSSTLLTLDRLDPYGFGMLLALYEHKVLAQGAIWGLNSFDQPGVELGKRLAKGLEAGAAPQSPGENFMARLFSHVAGRME